VISFLAARFSSALVVVLGVACLVFLLIHLVPGDPVEVMLGESARVGDREALRQTLGLDKPVLTQLLNYLQSLLHLDLGQSLYSKRAITDILAERLPATALLAAVALLVAIAIALPMGMLAALRQNSFWDFGAMSIAMVGVSIPNFVMGPLLILLFSFTLGWFPVSGMQGPASIVLPAITLGTALAAILSRMVRATLLEVLNEDFVRTATAAWHLARGRRDHRDGFCLARYRTTHRRGYSAPGLSTAASVCAGHKRRLRDGQYAHRCALRMAGPTNPHPR
jgi:peptide/nickel transport system permease protein